jgi:hypothetical protein
MLQQPRSHFPMPRNQEIKDDQDVLQKLQQIQLNIDEVRSVERLASLAEVCIAVTFTGEQFWNSSRDKAKSPTDLF